jgi:signal transduction histidine kinase
MMELHGGTFELTSEVAVGTQAKIIFPRDRLVYPAGQPATVDIAA